MKDKFIKYFKDICLRTNKLSTCQSKQVSCVLVKNNRILAISYNGTSSGKKHCNKIKFKNRDEHHLWSVKNEIHAEQNLIAFCAKEGIIMNNTVLFVSLSPCIHCAKILKATGIHEIYYIKKYDKDIEGLKFLKNNKIKCEKI